jgi:hypothetical protein
MNRVHRYELGFNAPRRGLPSFAEAVSIEARRYGIRWILVQKGREDRFRGQVDKGRLRIGLFLNTQADGVNMKSPSMLLCRSLKANGCIVVEDPDDTPVYADRALLMSYLKRAGIPTPAFHVLKPRRKNGSIDLPHGTGSSASWILMNVHGMKRDDLAVGDVRLARARALSRKRSWNRGEALMIRRMAFEKPAASQRRFAVWYLMGRIAAFACTNGGGRPELATADTTGTDRLLAIADTASRISQVTGLDWFTAELTAMKTRARVRYYVTVPPNALAGLGPGSAVFSTTPDDAVDCAAASIVRAAWRHSKGLDVLDGTTTVVGTSVRGAAASMSRESL